MAQAPSTHAHADAQPVLPTIEPQSPSDDISLQDQKQNSHGQAVLSYFKQEISISHADIPIIACCYVSGLCDSSAFNAWSTFVSMQTGNTIILALGASNQPSDEPYGWVKCLTSISCFLLGCFFFSNSRRLNAKARGTLAVSFVLQSICIIVAASLVQSHVVPEPHGTVPPRGINFIECIAIGFLAFQSGGQTTTSRLLGFNEVPTTVLTSVYCDVASDPNLLAKDNVKRNRRLGAILMILLGGISGGWISRSRAGMSISLWVAAAIKLGIACSWSIWKPNQPISL